MSIINDILKPRSLDHLDRVPSTKMNRLIWYLSHPIPSRHITTVPLSYEFSLAPTPILEIEYLTRNPLLD